MRFYAPSALYGHLHPGKDEKDKTSFRSFLLEEERLRGIILNVGSIQSGEIAAQPGYSSLVAQEEHQSEESLRQLTSRIVTYIHHRARYAARSLEGEGAFNPYLVVGMTAAVVDRIVGFHVGDLVQLVHTLDFRSGQGSTHFTFRNPRWMGRPSRSYIPDWLRRLENEVPEGMQEGEGRPSWFNESLSDVQIGKTLYAPLLGYTDEWGGNILRPVEPKSDTLETLEQALSRLREGALHAGEPRDYALPLVRRPLATELESYLALGAEPDDDEEVKKLSELDLNDTTVWEGVREESFRKYRNPEGASQSIADPIEQAARGPFLKERQEWVGELVAEVQERVAYDF
jgi:hypothetical protein